MSAETLQIQQSEHTEIKLAIKIAIKLDVDTLAGYLHGVPALLDLFEKKGIRASVFFSMGPDNSGKAIRRVFRKGFINKMIRTRAPSSYGLKTLMYGTLLPAPMISAKNPDILKRAALEHDCGVHAWDHVHIQDNIAEMTEDEIRAEYKKAFNLFEYITGKRAASMAAPGWQVTPSSLLVTDELGLVYASDTRGTSPYYPEVAGHVYKTLQIPTTLPTMDELMGLTDGRSAPDVWLDMLQHKREVLTVHAEMEGRSKLRDFEQFIDRALAAGIEFITLADIAEEYRNSAPVSGITSAPVKGRAGDLVQQTDSSSLEEFRTDKAELYNLKGARRRSI